MSLKDWAFSERLDAWKAEGSGMPAEILKFVKMFIRVTDVYLGSVFTWDREYCLRGQNSGWLKLSEYTVS